jgi:hypothetical protein
MTLVETTWQTGYDAGYIRGAFAIYMISVDRAYQIAEALKSKADAVGDTNLRIVRSAGYAQGIADAIADAIDYAAAKEL